MARRIGLLTFHHIINEGAILQTYSLFKKLENIFEKEIVEVINYVSLSAEKNYLNNILSDSKNPKMICEKLFRFYKSKNFIKKNLRLSEHSISTDDYEDALNFIKDKYDLIVVGSDEIWKIEKGKFARPFPNIYWLGKELNCLKVAYAASANKLEFKDLGEAQKTWIRNCLETFNLIGVRDNHTYDMISHVGIKNMQQVQKVPDPTFMLAVPYDHLKSKLEKLGVDFARPRICFTFDDKNFVPEVVNYYKLKGCQTIAITVFNPNVELNLAGKLNPIEWAGLFRYLTFCFTSLFHGTIFSLKGGSPFLSFDYFSNSKYETKLQCLLGEFDLLDRYIPTEGQKLSADLIINKAEETMKKHNSDVLNNKLTQQKQQADDFCQMIKGVLDDQIR